MERKNLLVSNQRRVPNKSRRPVKRPPLKVRKSFAADLQKFKDADNMYNPLKQQAKASLTDKITIKKMKAYKRWPIPEALMGRPQTENFYLKVDSIIADAYLSDRMREWANHRAAVPAPYNSMESADDYQIIPSEDSEDADKIIDDTVLPVDKENEFNFDKSILDASPFRMGSLRYYPYKQREGEVPTKLLKVPKLEFLSKTSTIIMNEQKGERQWSMETIQEVFDYYCLIHKAITIPLK